MVVVLICFVFKQELSNICWEKHLKIGMYCLELGYTGSVLWFGFVNSRNVLIYSYQQYTHVCVVNNDEDQQSSLGALSI